MPELQKVKIIKDQLSNIDEAEVAMFFDVGHIANEINSFNKLFYWSLHGESKSEPIVVSQTTYLCMFLRVLAGKFHEAHIYLAKHMYSKPKLSIYYDSFSEIAKFARNNINKYFGSNNLLKILRNSQSFHYDNDLLGNHEEKLKDEYFFYKSEEDGNRLYYHSEVIKLARLLEIVSAEDVNWDCDKSVFDLFDSFIEDIQMLFSSFMTVFTEIMKVFTKKYPEVFESEDDLIKVDQNVVDLKSFKLPWFYANDINDNGD